MRMVCAAMYTLRVIQTFDAAHVIPGHPGKCRNLHGHTYRVEAQFSGTELDELGMLQDFSELKQALREILPDHTYLNDVLDGPTTAEGISAWIYRKLKERDLPVAAVTVWETPNCGCTYSEDGN